MSGTENASAEKASTESAKSCASLLRYAVWLIGVGFLSMSGLLAIIGRFPNVGPKAQMPPTEFP